MIQKTVTVTENRKVDQSQANLRKSWEGKGVFEALTLWVKFILKTIEEK